MRSCSTRVQEAGGGARLLCFEGLANISQPGMAAIRRRDVGAPIHSHSIVLGGFELMS
jgi:hypothetical protein